jgi:hypothetical protein
MPRMESAIGTQVFFALHPILDTSLIRKKKIVETISNGVVKECGYSKKPFRYEIYPLYKDL